MTEQEEHIIKLESALESQIKQNQALQQQNQQMIQELTHLRHQVDKLMNMLFGSQSERQSKKSSKSNHTSDQDSNKGTNRNNKNKNTAKRKPLPEHLPRQKFKYELSESERACPCCGQLCHIIGKEVSEQLEIIPAKLFVKQHIRYKYGCRIGCTVKTAPMPAQPIEKGLAGPGLLSDVIVAKYEDALPLYRQSQRFKRHDIIISDSTLCDWIKQSAILLEPIVEGMKSEIILSKKLHTDDTIVPVLAKEKTKNARLWVYVADGSSSSKITIYDFTPTRSQKGPLRFLNNFKGYLQADAYAGYNSLYKKGEIIEVGCLAHVRRKFFDIIKASKQPGLADDAIDIIAEIYQIEIHIRDFSYQQRYFYRRRFSKPLYRKFKRWLIKQKELTLPKTPIQLAINYALNHWQALQNVFLDGACEVDNNIAERAIKPVVIGRKNYLFAGSYDGGHRAAIIYSIIETCKQNDINTFEYLKDVLTRLPTQKAGNIVELYPYYWQPLMSDQI